MKNRWIALYVENQVGVLAKVSGLIGILLAGPVAEVLAFFLAAALVTKELKKMGHTKLEEKRG